MLHECCTRKRPIEKTQLTIAKWIYEHGQPNRDWRCLKCESSAELGDLTDLQWARAYGCRWNSVNTWRAAIRGNKKHILNWLSNYSVPY